MVSAGSDAGHRRAHEKFKISTMLGQNGKTAKRGVEPSKYKESGFAESAKPSKGSISQRIVSER